MPIIKLQAGTQPTILALSIASQIPERLNFGWFEHQPEFDELNGQRLVPSALDSPRDQSFNHAHPSHSFIPPVALLQNAADAAFTADHRNSALKTQIDAYNPSGGTYRRVEIKRPPLPGRLTTSNPRRPFSLYQLAWKKTSGGTAQSLRLPISGSVYIPLENQEYRFWAIPRSEDPSTTTEGITLKLSEKQATRHYIDLPTPFINTTLSAADSVKQIFAHLHEYDSARIWKALVDLGGRYRRYKRTAERKWNVDVLSWYIYRSSAMADYAPIYGFINASAGRHGLSPELLHAVFMGEGVGADDGLIEMNRTATPRVTYADDQIINGWEDLGLDEIQDTITTLTADGYLDSSFSGSLINLRSEINEIGETKRTADVKGWEAAIELIAAEVHSRLDFMLQFCSTEGIPITTELQRRYLAYIRYNAKVSTSKDHARHLADKIRKWVGARPAPTDLMNPRYNTLQRIAVIEWYEASGVYR